MERPARPGLRWTRAEQWHITLRFFAAVDPEALSASLARLDWPAPVTAEAGPGPGVLARKVWVLPVHGLDRLAAAVGAATAGLGGPDGRPFTGHLTLARARRPEALEGLPTPAVAARWTVEEVIAVRSELLPGGARHHLIGRWPAGDG